MDSIKNRLRRRPSVTDHPQPVVPAKRSNRLKSAPSASSHASHNQGGRRPIASRMAKSSGQTQNGNRSNAVQPSSMHDRSQNASGSATGGHVQNRKTMHQLVTINYRLLTEALTLRDELTKKKNKIMHLQAKIHHQEIKCIKTENEKERLEESLEKLKAAKAIEEAKAKEAENLIFFDGENESEVENNEREDQDFSGETLTETPAEIIEHEDVNDETVINRSNEDQSEINISNGASDFAWTNID